MVVPPVFPRALLFGFFLLLALAALGLLISAVPAGSPATASVAPCSVPRPWRAPSLTWPAVSCSRSLQVSKFPPSVAGTTLISRWCPACAPINWHSASGPPLVVPPVFPRALLFGFFLLLALAALGLLISAVPAGSPATASVAPCSVPRPWRAPSLTWLPCLLSCCGGSTCVSAG